MFRIDVARDAKKGEDERAVLARALEPERCYIGDRGYVKTELFNKIHEIGSNYVIRVKDDTQFELLEEYQLTIELTLRCTQLSQLHLNHFPEIDCAESCIFGTTIPQQKR
ncbi:MAG: hypothetical protein ACI9HK_005156 [Pirellulaceae bacterium]